MVSARLVDPVLTPAFDSSTAAVCVEGSMPKALYREFDELACAEIISQYHLANYIQNNTECQTH